MTREEIQVLAKSSAIEAISKTSRASLIVGTGIGKTKITLDILVHFNPDKITWLTNSEKLRDEDTILEFYKWGYEYLIPKVEFQCYQTSYKWEDRDLGFVVADEGDVSLTEAYSKVYFNNRIDKLLLVSATVTEDKSKLLERIAPVVFTYSTQDAEDDGILNKTKYVFISYDLDTTKNIKVEANGKSWFTSESDSYSYWDGQYMMHLIGFLGISKSIDEHYKGIKIIPNFNYEETKKKKAGLKAKMSWASKKRAEILYSLKSSKELAKRVINKVLKNPNNKIISFCKLTKEIDSVCEYTYHSKNKLKSNIELLNQGKIKSLGVCSAIDRGVNLNAVNNFLFIDYDGSATKGQQRAGRGKRLPVEDEATIYILVPYFYKNGKRLPTRAYSWADSMLSDFNLTKENVVNLSINELS